MEKLKVYLSVGTAIFSPLCWVAYNHPTAYSAYFSKPIFYFCLFIILIHLLMSAFVNILISKLSSPENKIFEDQEMDFRAVSWATSQTEECRPNPNSFVLPTLAIALNVFLNTFPLIFNLDLEPKQGGATNKPIKTNTNYRLIDVHSDTRKYIIDNPSKIKKEIKGINMLQTENNWKNEYLNNWIRVEGNANIGSSWVTLEDSRGDITIIFDDENIESDMIWLSTYPDGIKLTAEGKITKAIDGNSMLLWEGKLISVGD